MKKKCLVGVLLVFALIVSRPVGSQQTAKPQVYVALYERGPKWVEGKSPSELPNFAQHIEHLGSLGQHRVGAGPVAARAGEPLIGIVVLLAESEEEARKLAEADPFVVAGHTKVKIWRWQIESLKGCF